MNEGRFRAVSVQPDTNFYVVSAPCQQTPQQPQGATPTRERSHGTSGSSNVGPLPHVATPDHADNALRPTPRRRSSHRPGSVRSSTSALASSGSAHSDRQYVADPSCQHADSRRSASANHASEQTPSASRAPVVSSSTLRTCPRSPLIRSKASVLGVPPHAMLRRLRQHRRLACTLDALTPATRQSPHHDPVLDVSARAGRQR